MSSPDAAATEPKPEQTHTAPVVVDEKPPATATVSAAAAEEEDKQSNPFKKIFDLLFGCLKDQVKDQVTSQAKEAWKDQQSQVQAAQDQVTGGQVVSSDQTVSPKDGTVA